MNIQQSLLPEIPETRFPNSTGDKVAYIISCAALPLNGSVLISTLEAEGYSAKVAWGDVSLWEDVWELPELAGINEGCHDLEHLFFNLYKKGDRYCFMYGRIGNTTKIFIERRK